MQSKNKISQLLIEYIMYVFQINDTFARAGSKTETDLRDALLAALETLPDNFMDAPIGAFTTATKKLQAIIQPQNLVLPFNVVLAIVLIDKLPKANDKQWDLKTLPKAQEGDFQKFYCELLKELIPFALPQAEEINDLHNLIAEGYTGFFQIISDEERFEASAATHNTWETASSIAKLAITNIEIGKAVSAFSAADADDARIAIMLLHTVRQIAYTTTVAEAYLTASLGHNAATIPSKAAAEAHEMLLYEGLLKKLGMQ